ncbi:MAG: sugar phosphate isomerase/epimerase family protein [Acidobacteriota bacterium]
MRRREFVKNSALAGLTGSLAMPAARALFSERLSASGKRFRISLAAWSVHKAFFAGDMKMIDQPAFCREMGIEGLELVNSFFPSPQYAYLQEFRRAARENGVETLLIMCDREGDMAHPERRDRMQASKNHRKWVDIAHTLGCHSIRCNSGSGRRGDKQAIQRAAESFYPLCEYAAQAGLNVVIENHGGLSSFADDLIQLMEAVGLPNFGTLPDFGNFPEGIDRYQSVKKMMPYAKAVSAKCYDFDPQSGEETKIDYTKMMDIVLSSGYSGWVGIEYEGGRLSEKEGVAACRKLLERFQ